MSYFAKLSRWPIRRITSVVGTLVLGGAIIAYVSQLVGPAVQIRDHGVALVRAEAAKLPAYQGSTLTDTQLQAQPFHGEDLLEAFSAADSCTAIEQYYVTQVPLVGWRASGPPVTYPARSASVGALLSYTYGKREHGYQVTLGIQCYVNLTDYTVEVSAD